MPNMVSYPGTEASLNLHNGNKQTRILLFGTGHATVADSDFLIKYIDIGMNKHKYLNASTNFNGVTYKATALFVLQTKIAISL